MKTVKKLILLFAIILNLNLSLIAQNKKEAYRVVFEGKSIVMGQLSNENRNGNWLFFNFNGDTIMHGCYNDGLKDGKWIYYDNRREISELNYKHGLRDGIWISHFGTGEIAIKRTYQDDLLNGKTTSYYKSGVIRQEKFYNNDRLDSVKIYNEQAVLHESGSISNGFKVGKWCCQSSTHKDSVVTYTLADSIKFQQSDAEILYCNDKYIIEERMPLFPGGNEKLLKYLQDCQLKAKELDKKKNQGIVKLRFYINVVGEPEDIEVIQSVSKVIDDEAIRIVRDMPNWMPGLQNGFPVNVSYVLPLRF